MTDHDSSGLVVQEVTVEFGGLVALNEVSLQANSGEIVGVIGPNGAGKTTLFNVICGFVRPNTGTLSFDGKPLRRHHPHDLAKLGIVRTLQSVGLCAGLSILENVMIGRQSRARGRLRLGRLRRLALQPRGDASTGQSARAPRRVAHCPIRPGVSRACCPTASRSGRRWRGL